MTNEPQRSGRALSELDTCVLFDVMAEVANGLRGTYIALGDHAESRGRTDEAAHWRALNAAVHRQRNALHPDERDAVIGAIEDWTAEQRRLDSDYPVE